MFSPRRDTSYEYGTNQLQQTFAIQRRSVVERTRFSQTVSNSSRPWHGGMLQRCSFTIPPCRGCAKSSITESLPRLELALSLVLQLYITLARHTKAGIRSQGRDLGLVFSFTSATVPHATVLRTAALRTTSGVCTVITRRILPCINALLH